MGDLLGGPSKDKSYLLPDNSINYNRRANEKDFLDGIQRLKKGLKKNYKIAVKVYDVFARQHMQIIRFEPGRSQ